MLIARHPEAVPVSEITRLYVAKTYNDSDAAVIERALRVESLPDSWKDHLRERLAK
jgi:hypothetical protein